MKTEIPALAAVTSPPQSPVPLFSKCLQVPTSAATNMITGWWCETTASRELVINLEKVYIVVVAMKRLIHHF